MKTIKQHADRVIANIISIPDNLRQILTDKVSEMAAELIKEEVIRTLESEGYDVNITVNLHIKKH